MAPRAKSYGDRAREILRDTPQVRGSVTAACLNWERKRIEALAEVDAEAWRERAEAVKNHLLSNLGRYLEEAEERLTSRGAVVHWAEDAAAAGEILTGIVRARGSKRAVKAQRGMRAVKAQRVMRAVKAKSMLGEELGVNEVLASAGVEVLETDLGEYIIQLLGQPPSHIVGPAIHLGLAEIRELFRERLGTPGHASPEAIAAKAREVLREAFLGAEIGISGGNFLVAETGTLALMENEGNIRLCTSAPPVHVAFVGIEKLLPKLSDLALFLQITPRSATGQRIGNYVSLIQGPRRGDEGDGPEELHVVLVDNGRSSLLADPEAWEALRCIRCGACLNACPVYRQTGGHAYGWAYSGPIGSVLQPGLKGLEQGWSLPYASSLCGACSEACPVRIPIPRLLLGWRRRAAEAEFTPRAEAFLMRVFENAMASPAFYRAGAAGLGAVGRAGAGAALPVLGSWVRVRAPLKPDRESFRTRWEEGIE